MWRSRSRNRSLVAWLWRLAAVVVLVQAWRAVSGSTIWEFTADAPAVAADLLGRMVPPDWPFAAELVGPLWETLTIATLGTLLAVVAALPIALLAAENTTPLRGLRPVALLLIVSSRSINSLIWALLLVAVLGPGPVAGILAIALRSIGFIAKLLYEGMEEIDPVPVEAVTASGAARPLVLAYGVWPQILPAFAGISLFRWDINIREATVLGLVGAGGIGLQLDAAVSALKWDRAALILLVIVALVLVGEAVSARVRRAVT